jgi:hypothetical protein
MPKRDLSLDHTPNDPWIQRYAPELHGCSKVGIKGSFVIPAKAGIHLHAQTNRCLPAQA